MSYLPCTPDTNTSRDSHPVFAAYLNTDVPPLNVHAFVPSMTVETGAMGATSPLSESAWQEASSFAMCPLPRTDLRGELVRQLVAFSRLEENWDGEGGSAIKGKVIWDAHRLGEAIIRHQATAAPSLNLKPTNEGGVMFTLFGVDGRSVDLWIDPSAPGRFHYVTDRVSGYIEGDKPLDLLPMVAAWLAGRGTLA